MAAVTWVLLTQPDPGEMTAAHMRQFQAYVQGEKWPNTAILKLRMDNDLGIDCVI